MSDSSLDCKYCNMSEHSISIVPKLSTYPGRDVKAEEILKWLVSLDIVKATVSDCILGSEGGYAISNGARLISSEPDMLPFGLWTNGLGIITERQIFHTGENGMEELICPACKQNIADEDWDFFNEWADNTSNSLTCPLCNVSTDIQQYKYTPEWGFSDLGFTFWNWPGFTDKFIDDFKMRLGCEISLVYTWL